MLNVGICLHAQLIRLFRRAGRIDEVGPYLSRAEKATPAAPFHAGLSFCKGLLARYCNKPHDAIMVCLPSMCIFDKVFTSFLYSTRKNSHKNKMHVN